MAFVLGSLAPVLIQEVIGPIVKKVLTRDDVPIDNAAVPAATDKVVQAVAKEMANQNMTVVPVKSAWKSKINWSAGILLAFTALDFIGHPVPADAQDALTKAASVLVPLAIIIFKTKFSNGVTAGSIR